LKRYEPLPEPLVELSRAEGGDHFDYTIIVFSMLPSSGCLKVISFYQVGIKEASLESCTPLLKAGLLSG
jgi:hypothetical protein